MTLLVKNQPFTAALVNVTANILDLNAGPHALTFNKHSQELVIENNEAVPLTINLLGDGVTSFNCPGVGTVDLSAGVDLVVPAGATATIYTAKVSEYCGATGNNTVLTVTGSTAPSLGYVWLNEYP